MAAVSEQIRVLVVDDDALVRAGLSMLLAGAKDIEIVGEATDGSEVAQAVAEHQPDIVLMDIGMPVRDGIEATRAIHARDTGQHVVIYTGSDEYADVARADAAGATGYLHKDALTSPDLADALHVLHTNHLSSIPDPE